MIFYLGVIIPATVAPADTEDWVDQRLTDTTWPESRCTCFGGVADREARSEASKLVPLPPYKEYLEANAGLDPTVVRKNWREIIRPRNDLFEELYSEHPMRWLPDPDCGSCGGTGRCSSYKRCVEFRTISPMDTISVEEFSKMLEEGRTPFHFLLEPNGKVSRVENEVFMSEVMLAEWTKRSLEIIRPYPGARLGTVWL